MSKRRYSFSLEDYFYSDKYFKMADDAMDPAIQATREIRSDAKYRYSRLRVPKYLANSYVAIRQSVPLGLWTLDDQKNETAAKFGDAMTFFDIRTLSTFVADGAGPSQTLDARGISLDLFYKANSMLEKMYQTYSQFRIRSVCLTFTPVNFRGIDYRRMDSCVWWVQNSFDIAATNPHADYGSSWANFMESKEPRTWMSKSQDRGFRVKFVPNQDDQGGVNPAGAGIWHNVPSSWLSRDAYWKTYQFKCPIIVFRKPVDPDDNSPNPAYTVSASAIIEFKDPDPVSE